LYLKKSISLPLKQKTLTFTLSQRSGIPDRESETAPTGPAVRQANLGTVILATAAGAMFEWYDFYIYGLLAPFFANSFFRSENPDAAFLASMALVGVAFFFRPIGALFFGWLGDTFGRKYSFLGTIGLMGSTTALIGLLPTYDEAGIRAPIALLVLRILQGIALGGEYGGAIIYVGEHTRQSRRGFTTSIVQSAGPISFLLTLVAVSLSNLLLTPTQFTSWGWRILFLISLVLLGVSLYIRKHLPESPVFQELKRNHQTCPKPIREGLCRWKSLRLVLIALFGCTIGASVIAYNNELYLFYFLTSILKVSIVQATLCMAIGILPSIPIFFLAGQLCDKIGAKPVFLTGCVISVFLFFPVFHWIACNANPALNRAVKSAPVMLVTGEFKGTSGLVRGTLLDVFGRYKPAPEYVASAEARAYLGKRGIPFSTTPVPDGSILKLQVGNRTVSGFDENEYRQLLDESGYPNTNSVVKVRFLTLAGLILLLTLPTAFTLGSLGSILLNLFPAKHRYTSLSVAYHLGIGWAAGCLPLVATSIIVFTGNFYKGLWYPTFWVVVTIICAILFIPNQSSLK
jgi:MFS family permease